MKIRQQIINLLREGWTLQQIAKGLGLSVETVLGYLYGE